MTARHGQHPVLHEEFDVGDAAGVLLDVELPRFAARDSCAMRARISRTSSRSVSRRTSCASTRARTASKRRAGPASPRPPRARSSAWCSQVHARCAGSLERLDAVDQQAAFAVGRRRMSTSYSGPPPSAWSADARCAAQGARRTRRLSSGLAGVVECSPAGIVQEHQIEVRAVAESIRPACHNHATATRTAQAVRRRRRSRRRRNLRHLDSQARSMQHLHEISSAISVRRSLTCINGQQPRQVAKRPAEARHALECTDPRPAAPDRPRQALGAAARSPA